MKIYITNPDLIADKTKPAYYINTRAIEENTMETKDIWEELEEQGKEMERLLIEKLEEEKKENKTMKEEHQ